MPAALKVLAGLAALPLVLLAAPAQAGDRGPLDPATLDLTPWLAQGNSECTTPASPHYLPLRVVEFPGACKDGKLNGTGTLVLDAEGREIRITATFANGAVEGRARVAYADDYGSFDGEFHANRPDGPGVWTDFRDTRTQGEFRNGALLGPGTITQAGGASFEASFAGGVLQGPTVLRLGDGTRIETVYRDGKPDGRCETVFSDGSRLTTYYADGVALRRAVFRGDAGRRFAGYYEPARRDPAGPKQPHASMLSRRLNERGTVEVALQIRIDGSVQVIGLHQSSGFERLDNIALAAVPRWRYHPAMVDGHPVATTIVAAIVFNDPPIYSETMSGPDMPLTVLVGK